VEVQFSVDIFLSFDNFWMPFKVNRSSRERGGSHGSSVRLTFGFPPARFAKSLLYTKLAVLHAMPR